MFAIIVKIFSSNTDADLTWLAPYRLYNTKISMVDPMQQSNWFSNQIVFGRGLVWVHLEQIIPKVSNWEK